MLGVYAGVEANRAVEAVDIVLDEIKTLKAHPVTPAELKDSKEFTKGNLMLSAESNENQMVRLAQNEMLFGKYVPLEDVLEKIDRVTQEDILELTGDLFQTDQMALTMLGPVKEEQPYKDLLSL
jgi:predicted Zn-dependent peptidase